MTEVTLREASEAIAKMVREHNNWVKQILVKHGAHIEAKAAVLTPVDKGFLRRANTYKVKAEDSAVSMTIENRMIYARYQHDYPHRHTQPQARDHFISIPFEAELPLIVDDIIGKDMKEATS